MTILNGTIDESDFACAGTLSMAKITRKTIHAHVNYMHTVHNNKAYALYFIFILVLFIINNREECLRSTDVDNFVRVAFKEIASLETTYDRIDSGENVRFLL